MIDTRTMRDCLRVGRQELIDRIHELCDEIDSHAIRLKGWTCNKCACFNGEEVEPLKVCRACGNVQ